MWWLRSIELAAAVLLLAAFSLTSTRADPPQGDAPKPDLPKTSQPQPATPTPPSPSRAIPSDRAAQNVAVITVKGPIDEWTLRSVQRRMELARTQGADALVFEVDSPGGGIVPCLLIAGEIKKSPIPNTTAWVHPMAYSGGAIISLACRRIVISDGAALGDAIPIVINPLFSQLERLPADEREKFAGPVIADLIDSARRNGYDEMMVQGFVRRGVELWLVEHEDTGQRLFVTEEQYRVAVGEEPERLSPTIRSGAGPMDPSLSGGGASKPRKRRPVAGAGQPLPPSDTDFTPAARYSPDAAAQINQDLSVKQAPPNTRPNLADPAHRGKYKTVQYVLDGTGVLTLRERELLDYGVAKEQVRTDDELKAYFGAKNVVRLDENWADHAARFLSNFFVKAFLIIVFIIALFVEMTHPGLSLPGGIAAICLLGLVLPPILAGVAGWWTLLAIIVGIALICVELFVTPGVVVFGVLGVLSLFAGLVGTFLVGPGGGLFPGAGRGTGDIAWATTTVLLSLVVSGVAIGFLLRHLPQLPILKRLVLTSGADGFEDATPGSYTQAFEPIAAIQPGASGTAVTPLRPSGRVQIGEKLVDAMANGSFIESGERVRVVSSSANRVIVESDPA